MLEISIRLGHIKRPWNGKLRPEMWELRGTKRLATKFYDLDLQYQFPQAKEFVNFKTRQGRFQNVLTTCQIKFGL